jgi:DNA-binding GntR family transcriptional regulator
VTLSDEVFEALVKDILSGAVEPGARLDEPSICRKFGVSRTPIREALRRLSGTGLVEMAPRKGVTVARIDVEQLNNMFEALAEFEGLCSRLSAVRMTTIEKRRLEVLNASRQKLMARRTSPVSTMSFTSLFIRVHTIPVSLRSREVFDRGSHRSARFSSCLGTLSTRFTSTTRLSLRSLRRIANELMV